MNNLKCQYCDKEFSRKEGLTRHINNMHLHKTNNQSKVQCKFCNLKIGKNFLVQHLVKQHQVKLVDAVIDCELKYRKKFTNEIPENILRQYLKSINDNDINSLNEFKYFSKQFNSFYKMITTVEAFNENHIKQFINEILPWKIKHPKNGNNLNLVKLIYKDDIKKQNTLYKKYMLEKNPYYQHDGTISVFSKDYKGYVGLSEEEKEKIIYKIEKHDMVGRNVNQKEYWIKRGYSENDAIIEAKKHINVFSLEKCIERYGVENGTKRFRERQIKWQQTLKSKPLEEQMRINHSKVYKNGPKSGIEYEFLTSIDCNENHHNVYLKDLGIVDFIDGNKIIEFYGDYWHCNPKDKRFSDGKMFHPYLKMTASEKWEFDNTRINKLKSAGYDVKVVWEMDYKNNKELIIEDCRRFLNEK